MSAAEQHKHAQSMYTENQTVQDFQYMTVWPNYCGSAAQKNSVVVNFLALI